MLPMSLSWEDTVKLLSRYSPEVANDICQNAERPLYSYASEIFTPPDPLNLFNDAEVKLRTALRQYLEQSPSCGIHEDEFEAIIDEFFLQRVVLTGPHLQLLFDPEPFYGLILSALGASKSDRRYVFWHANTTGRLNLANRIGPGWLTLEDAKVNLFDLSVRQMNQLTPFGATGRYKFRPKVDGVIPVNRYKGVLEDISNISPQSIRGLFHAANDKVWNVCNKDLQKIVVLDDKLNSLLISLYVQDRTSVLTGMLFEKGILDLQLRLFQEAMLADTTKMLPFGTDFFWHNRGDRFIPMRLNSEQSHLVSACGQSACAIAWNSNDIVTALQENIIVPNVYLMMLTFSILPSVRANGGPRQIIYMPVIHRIARQVLRSLLGKDIPLDTQRLHGLGSDVIYPVPGLIPDVVASRDYNGITLYVENLKRDSSSLVDHAKHLRTIREYSAWHYMARNQ